MDSKEYGLRIQKKRKERGISQEELAGKIGVNRQTLSNYETGTTSVNLETLAQIAEALGFNPAELLSEEASPVSCEKKKTQRTRFWWLAEIGTTLTRFPDNTGTRKQTST